MQRARPGHAALCIVCVLGHCCVPFATSEPTELNRRDKAPALPQTCMRSGPCGTLKEELDRLSGDGATRDEAKEAKEAPRARALLRGENSWWPLTALCARLARLLRNAPTQDPALSVSRAIIADVRAAFPVPSAKPGAGARTDCDGLRPRAWAAPERRLRGDAHWAAPPPTCTGMLLVLAVACTPCPPVILRPGECSQGAVRARVQCSDPIGGGLRQERRQHNRWGMPV